VNIDDRLRAASRALEDSSVAQVDAASRLREIVRHTGQLRRKPQRLAMVASLLLVLALGILLGRAASDEQGAVITASTTAASTVVTQPVSRTQVPETCLDAAELADEVISRLNRNQRDNRLAAVLRDYSIASQACRRAASRLRS
jgi:hypothetical protein